MKIEINKKKKTGKNTNLWKLNNMVLKPMGQRKNQRGNKNYHEKNETGNITFQNLWDAAKAVQRWKFIAIWAYH